MALSKKEQERKAAKQAEKEAAKLAALAAAMAARDVQVQEIEAKAEAEATAKAEADAKAKKEAAEAARRFFVNSFLCSRENPMGQREEVKKFIVHEVFLVDGEWSKQYLNWHSIASLDTAMSGPLPLAEADALCASLSDEEEKKWLAKWPAPTQKWDPFYGWDGSGHSPSEWTDSY